jgi:carboxyl-terminal processing protease
MIRRALLIFFVVFILAGPGVNQTRRPSYLELFDAVWQTINDNFYDPAFGGVDWKAIRQKYLSEVAAVKDDQSFLTLVYRMMRELHASHLDLVPLQAPQAGIGIRTRQIEGVRIITTVAIASDAQKQGVRVGDVLLDQPGSLTGQLGTTASVHVKSCDGRTRTLEVKRENPWWPPEHPSLRWRTIEQGKDRRIGYIKASRFDDDAAPLIDEAMKAVKDTYGLIIDLRNDSGGNLSSLRLISYLIPGPKMTVALLSRPFLEKLGGAPEQINLSKIPRVSGVYTTRGILDAMKNNAGGVAFYTEDVGSARYLGKVILLINKGTGSASEGFAAVLKGQRSITLVGETTAGQLLGGERFDLPGGWQLTVPTHASWGPDGKRYIDQSVSPDVEVKWTLPDFCEQRDPDLARALELLNP